MFVGRSPFVGRVLERRAMLSALDSAASGSGGLLLVSGEPGIGKTTLCEQFRGEAAPRGFQVLRGACHDSDEAPYSPFLDVLEQLRGVLAPDVLAEVLGGGAGDVARLMPEIRRWLPGLAAPVQVPPEHERRLLFSGVAELLGRLSAIRPVLLVLEDLHWSDPGSLLLLTYLAPRLPGMAIVVVGTFRQSAAVAGTGLGATLDDLRRTHASEHLELQPFDREETGQLLSVLSGSVPPSGVADRLYDETEGNPFFLAEIFRYLSGEGLLLDGDGGWHAVLAVAELPVPPAVRLVIELRLRQLAPMTRVVLTAAAVAGRAATSALLVESLREPERAVVEALEEAEHANMITSSATASDVRYSFVHELIRLTLLAAVSPHRRQRLHASAARAIEHGHADRLDIYAAQLVHHLSRAGATAEPGRLLGYLVVAADHALGAAAFEDALSHVDAALGLATPGGGDEWVQLLVRRGRALCGLGRWDEAESAWQKAMRLLIAADAPVAVGQLSAEAAANLFWAGRYEQCMAAVSAGLDIVGDQVSIDRVRLLALGGRCAAFAGDRDMGERLTTEGLRVAVDLRDQGAQAVAGFARTVHHWSWVEPAEAIRHGSKAAEAARSAGALWDLADGLGFLQLAHVLAGDVGEVAKIGVELEALVGRLGHYGAALVGGRGSLLLEITRGDLDAVQACAEEDLARCRDLDLPWAADSFAWLGLVAFWRGDWDVAEDILDRGLAHDSTGTLSGACWAASFLLRASRGDKPGCAQMMAPAALAGFPAEGRPAGLGNWTGLLAATEGVALLGNSDAAARNYPLVLRAIAAGNVLRGYDNRLVESVAGLAAAAGGHRDRADEHFRRAIRQADELPHRLEQPETRRLYAGVLLERGDPADRDRALELLDEAIEAYRRIGMPRHEAMGHALRARCTRTASPGGLTGREREILTLLAAGCTSKETGRLLSVSLATVQRHTANIYPKIGARNRAEATRWAIRHGLLHTDTDLHSSDHAR